jgi:hypothetical protein
MLMNHFGGQGLVPNRSTENWTAEDWREACSVLVANRDYHLARAQRLQAENDRLRKRKVTVDKLPPAVADEDYEEPKLRGINLDKEAADRRYFVAVASPLRSHGFRRKPIYCGYAATAEGADACAVEAWCRLVEKETGLDVREILDGDSRVTPSFRLRFPLRKEDDR